jgi:hypothetical protein
VFELLLCTALFAFRIQAQDSFCYALLGLPSGDGFIDVSFNNLTESIAPVFCDGPNPPPVILTADCTKVNCTCCTNCCDDVAGECVVNVPAICEGLGLYYEVIEDGPDSMYGTECQCVDEGFKLSCSDPGCNSCSNDGSVCANSIEYGYIFDDAGIDNNFRCDMQYVKGRNETVSFKIDFWINECQVLVDGVQCDSCNMQVCDSGLWRPRVDCSNIEPDAIFDACDPSLSSGGGLLAVFNEEFFLSDCRTCLL